MVGNIDVFGALWYDGVVGEVNDLSIITLQSNWYFKTKFLKSKNIPTSLFHY